MTNVSLAFPSKTFLIGEYSVLHDGYALLANTMPCFHIDITVSQTHHSNIHSASPAGKWIAAHQKQFHNCNINFSDPHQAQGGFGASTAQFAGVYRYCYPRFDPHNVNDLKSLHTAYCEFSNSGNQVPSGADLLSQQFAGLCWVNCPQTSVTSLAWPFSDIGFMLLRTGQKIATHEHLQKLTASAYPDLAQLTQQAYQGILLRESPLFVSSINHYHQALLQQGLVAAMTQTLIAQLQRLPGVVAIKGCGAMGADVILVVHDLTASTALQQAIGRHDLPIVASQQSLTRYNPLQQP